MCFVVFYPSRPRPQAAIPYLSLFLCPSIPLVPSLSPSPLSPSTTSSLSSNHSPGSPRLYFCVSLACFPLLALTPIFTFSQSFTPPTHTFAEHTPVHTRLFIVSSKCSDIQFTARNPPILYEYSRRGGSVVFSVKHGQYHNAKPHL